MHVVEQDMSGLKGLLALVVLVTAGAVACGGGSSGPDGGAEPEPEPAAAAAVPTATPRVFFMAPGNDTDHPTEVPLGITFGVENFEISPVPETASTPRPDVGHYHLGVDTECLPAGEIIPAADPWIHLGDGSDGMELQLEGGEYRLTVAIGDDEHRTTAGLCDTIVIRMEDGI